MTELEYFSLLKGMFEENAKKRGLHDGAKINIDWGELRFILSIAGSLMQNSNNSKMDYSCFVCGDTTQIIRTEQRFIVNKLECIKCMNCLMDQLLANRAETEQLHEYWWYIRESGLEENFEYFCRERRLGDMV